MREAHPLFDVLCKSADADCATALERLVHEAPDRRLNRINVLDFARREGLNEQRAITAFLQATQIGLLDMSWNVLCPSCGGVLDANATLQTVRSNEYYCAFCAVSSAGYARACRYLCRLRREWRERDRHERARGNCAGSGKDGSRSRASGDGGAGPR